MYNSLNFSKTIRFVHFTLFRQSEFLATFITKIAIQRGLGRNFLLIGLSSFPVKLHIKMVE